VIGTKTREDHEPVMNTMIRFYSGAKEAEKKQAMAFELSETTKSCCSSAQLFHDRFMDFNVNITLDDALNLGWKTLAECFSPEELLMKEDLIKKYFPQSVRAIEPGEEEEMAVNVRDEDLVEVR
jgi:V/A-type H+-transporting ATPase subunit B